MLIAYYITKILQNYITVFLQMQPKKRETKAHFLWFFYFLLNVGELLAKPIDKPPKNPL
jgi:hypothetical protein